MEYHQNNVGEEEIRVKIELFETCLAPAILYGFKQAWRWWAKYQIEMEAIEKNTKSVIKENTTATSNNKTMTYSVIKRQ